jgi:hypothetical protein
VTLSTARRGLGFKRSMITRGRGCRWVGDGGEESSIEDRRGPAEMVFLACR